DDVELVPIRLSRNLRNTRRIHELVRQHYSGHDTECLGPEGVEVRWIHADTENELRDRIAKCVAELQSRERISPEDIAVLVGSEEAIARVAPRNRIRESYTARCDEDTEGRVVVDTIRRFKGLERPVVVIAATPDIVSSLELPYVALSRARTHLIIAG